jgi:hypothetical protein
LLLCLTSCRDDARCEKAVDNSSPLSPKPLPDFTFLVQISPRATERLAMNKSRVRISVLPLKVADAGETADWLSFITMGPGRDVWVSQSGEVKFSGLKAKSRFLGNDGYNKIIANVNTSTYRWEADQVWCDNLEVPVAELVRTRHVIECRLVEEQPRRQRQVDASKSTER